MCFNLHMRRKGRGDLNCLAAQGTLRRCWLHNISQQPSAPPRYCAYWHFENMFWRQKNILEVCVAMLTGWIGRSGLD